MAAKNLRCEDVLNGNIISATFINLFGNSRPAFEIIIRIALFLIKLIAVRDNVFHLSNYMSLTRDEVNSMFHFIATA